MAIRSSKKTGDAVLFKTLDPQITRADLKKVSIIKAFIDCTVLYGLSGATFERVGERTKMKAPHVAYYFPDRESLLEGAIRFSMLKGQEFTVKRITDAKGPKDALAAMAVGAFDWLQAEPKYFSLVMLFYHLASYDKHYRDLHTQIRRAGEDRIEGLLEGLNTLPEASARRDRARDIQGLITGNLIGWATTKSEVSLIDVRDRTVATLMNLAGV